MALDLTPSYRPILFYSQQLFLPYALLLICLQSLFSRRGKSLTKAGDPYLSCSPTYPQLRTAPGILQASDKYLLNE